MPHEDDPPLSPYRSILPYDQQVYNDLTRLKIIKKHLELAKEGNLMQPLLYYYQDVSFLIQLLERDV